VRGAAYICLVGNSDEKDHMGDAGLDVGIILKCIYRKWYVGVGNGKRLLMIGALVIAAIDI